MFSFRGSEVTTNLGVMRCTSAHRLRKFRVFYFVAKLLAYLNFKDDFVDDFAYQILANQERRAQQRLAIAMQV